MHSSEERYRRAKKKVNRVKRFYSNLSTMLLVSLFLIILFYVLRLSPLITLIIIGAWGIALGLEALDLFGMPGMNKDWEQSMLEREMDKIEQEESLYSQNNTVEQSLELREPSKESGESLELKEIKEKVQKWNDADFV